MRNVSERNKWLNSDREAGFPTKPKTRIVAETKGRSMSATQEETLRVLLLRLESIQRDVGEVQKEIITLLG
jgi:hypothetical protein